MSKKHIYRFSIIACLLFVAGVVSGQGTDTLHEVKLYSKKNTDIIAAPVATQELSRAALANLNSLSVADAVKHFSGVVVKDYGGIGGLKTISVRSLGANHTGIMYDGIMIGDAQAGQVDLGRFSLDNIESIQLINNNPTGMLLPARSYASASVLALNTSSQERNKEKTGISLKLNVGSFGFIDPSVTIKHAVNDRLRNSLHAEYQHADGAYTFTDYETGGTKKKRENTDFNSFHTEYAAEYNFNDSNALKYRAYYYDSKRGLPGAVILYNNYSGQRLDIRNFFTQLSWQKAWAVKSRIMLACKYSADHKYYLDPAYPNSAGKLENEFYQKEYYLSAVYRYNITGQLAVNIASDYFNDRLKRTDIFAQQFANPVRNSFLQNILLRFSKKRVEADGQLLYTVLNEKVERGIAAQNRREWSPGISASFQPLISLPIRVRASYKSIFRAPSFDDLYYTNIGNTALLPEYVKQYNLGVTLDTRIKDVVTAFFCSADVYYNDVKDKIIAVPRQNLFQWTMLNIGKADIRGVDVAAHINFSHWGNVLFTMSGTYSYQRALDISDPASQAYKTQLPYIPKHSGSFSLNAGIKKLHISYNIVSSAYRYRLGSQTPDNLVRGWATHDLVFQYALQTKHHAAYSFIAGFNNIFNTNYEVIRFYPMPGFNFRVGVTATFTSTKLK